MAEYQYIDGTGVIVADTSTTKATVQDEYRAAFGADLDVSDETPQGVLIVAETLARQAVIRNNAALANQINPNIAGGVFLDAIWALTGGARVVATPSILRGVELAGVPGTIIDGGSRASVGASGALFALVSTVVLDAEGAGTGTFQAVDAGATAVAIGELNQIVTGVLGWETVSNPTAAEIGRAEETDAAARIRRRRTLAFQGVTLPEAITSGLYTVEGVRSLVFRENPTNAPVTIEGVTLTAHSVYACVDGGADADVATMLLRKKSAGAAWVGDTTVVVIEPNSGQDYAVKFSRPDEIPIYVRVTVRGTGYPDIPGLVRGAMVAYAQGFQDGEAGFVVGGDVSPFELGAAVGRVAPGLQVSSVTLSLDGITYSAAEISILISQIATLQASDIAVTVAA